MKRFSTLSWHVLFLCQAVWPRSMGDPPREPGMFEEQVDGLPSCGALMRVIIFSHGCMHIWGTPRIIQNRETTIFGPTKVTSCNLTNGQCFCTTTPPQCIPVNILSFGDSNGQIRASPPTRTTVYCLDIPFLFSHEHVVCESCKCVGFILWLFIVVLFDYWFWIHAPDIWLFPWFFSWWLLVIHCGAVLKTGPPVTIQTMAFLAVEEVYIWVLRVLDRCSFFWCQLVHVRYFQVLLLTKASRLKCSTGVAFDTTRRKCKLEQILLDDAGDLLDNILQFNSCSSDSSMVRRDGHVGKELRW